MTEAKNWPAKAKLWLRWHLLWLAVVSFQAVSVPSSDQKSLQKSVTHSQYDAKPTVTFPATEHQRPLTQQPNYTAWWQEAHELLKVATWKRNGLDVKPRPLSREFNARTITLPDHTAIPQRHRRTEWSDMSVKMLRLVVNSHDSSIVE